MIFVSVYAHKCARKYFVICEHNLVLANNPFFGVLLTHTIHTVTKYTYAPHIITHSQTHYTHIPVCDTY